MKIEDLLLFAIGYLDDLQLGEEWGIEDVEGFNNDYMSDKNPEKKERGLSRKAKKRWKEEHPNEQIPWGRK